MTQNKASIISPDKCTVSSPYTLTINPSDRFQFWSESMDSRIKKAKAHIVVVLNRLLPAQISLKIDVSRVGRIHWHGVIRFPTILSIKEFYTEDIQSLISEHQVEIDFLPDIDKWAEYCSKVEHLWKEEVSSKECAQEIKNLIMGGGSDINVFAPMDRYLIKEDNNKSENSHAATELLPRKMPKRLPV